MTVQIGIWSIGKTLEAEQAILQHFFTNSDVATKNCPNFKVAISSGFGFSFLDKGI
jgi:hypothetical protein